MRRLLFLLIIHPIVAGAQIQLTMYQNRADGIQITQLEDAPNLHKAIDLAECVVTADSATRVEIFVPNGTYRLEEGLKLDGANNITIKGESQGGVNIRGSVELTSIKRLNKRHPLFIKNPEVGRKIVEIDLSDIDVLKHKKIELEGFRGQEAPNHYTLNELYLDGEPMTLSRFPNEGFMRYDKILCDTINGVPQVGIPYIDTRIKEWVDEPNILLHGYWKWLWADAYESVKSIDTKGQVIWLQAPYNYYHFWSNRYFAGINVIAEIDTPKEYAYNYKEKKIYFYPPKDLNGASLELTLCEEPLISIINSDGVELQNLTLSEGSSMGILVENSSNTNIESCTIHGVARDAVIMDGGNNNRIACCDAFNCGRGAFRVDVGSYETLESGNLLIENCHTHTLSRIDKTYTPGIHVSGVGVHIRYCLFHDIPSSAIRLNGNDHLVEYNEFTRCVTESDDQGAIDMWGSANYRGNIIRYNYFHNNGPQSADKLDAAHGRAGVRLDDAICGVFIHSNIFNNSSNGSFGAVQIHGGKDNVVWNNLFYSCKIGISFTEWTQDHWHAFTSRTTRALFERHRGLYISKYPELLQYDKNTNNNTVMENIFYNCTQTHRNRGNDRNTWEDNLETTDSTSFSPTFFKEYQNSSVINSTPLGTLFFENIGLQR